jgi:single stranded DNA-binding protein
MLNKLIRLGRDAELRKTQTGKSVLGFAGAYDVGYGDKKKTQWIDCSLWGDQAERVASMLTKGTQVVIYADDVCIEEYPKNDGSTGVKLKCRVVNFEFAGPRPQAAETTYQQPAAQAPAPQQPAPAAGSFDDFDDDIPF